MGGFTALVSVEQRQDGTIIWHIESSSPDALLQVSDIQCLSEPWHQTLDLNLLQSAPALIR